MFSLIYTIPFLFLLSFVHSCPSNWTPSQIDAAKCYYVAQKPLTWQEAEAHCQSLGPKAYLTSVLSAFETNDIKGKYLSFAVPICDLTIFNTLACDVSNEIDQLFGTNFLSLFPTICNPITRNNVNKEFKLKFVKHKLMYTNKEDFILI